MNFSEFSESYDKTSKKKKEVKQKLQKRGDNPGDKNIVGQQHPFNTIGHTGLNGDGTAWEENISPNMDAEMNERMYHKTDKERKQDEDRALIHKAEDDRMRYGKKGKPSESETLRPGEVRRWDKVNKKWVSNKD